MNTSCHGSQFHNTGGQGLGKEASPPSPAWDPPLILAAFDVGQSDVCKAPDSWIRRALSICIYELPGVLREQEEEAPGLPRNNVFLHQPLACTLSPGCVQGAQLAGHMKIGPRLTLGPGDQ